MITTALPATQHFVSVINARPIVHRTPRSLVVRSTSDNPYLQEIQGSAGPKIVIGGTRVTVRAIANYTNTGLTPETIVREVLPDLTIEQVNDALKYYRSHRQEIDREIAENTEDSARAWLQSQLNDRDE